MPKNTTHEAASFPVIVALHDTGSTMLSDTELDRRGLSNADKQQYRRLARLELGVR